MRWFHRNRGSVLDQVPPAFEPLETRLALYQGPMISGMPPIASLENQFDTVVRIDTTVGRIDIELFDTLAPTTVQNFKAYVNAGKFDETFFSNLSGGVLQGGKFKFYDGTGLATVPALAPIANGFLRSNLAQTLAMVNDTSTTTSNQFIINLQDNLNLNTQNYTVFGKVIQGWNVVQAIGALMTKDLDQALTGSNPNPGTFDHVPVTNAFNQTTGPTEATLVRIQDIEVVKSNGTNRYYEQTLVFPEGFRSATTVERVDMVNLDPVHYNFYQVIVRYETGERDSVILSGVMNPSARISLKINDMNFPNYNIVRSGVGYAFEIRTTYGFSASLDHRDNGVTLGESFQLLARIFPGQLQQWNIAGGDKGPLFQSYILFQNLTDLTAQVNIILTSQNGQTLYIPVTLKAARRGGINVASLGNALPDGAFSVLISATQPIVASISEYQTGGPGNVSDGSAALATLTGGRVEGYLAGAYIAAGGDSHIDVYYSDPNLAAVFVDFEFILNDGTVLPGTVLLTNAQRRQRFQFLALNPTLPTNTYFTVHYTSRNGVTPITVAYSAEVAGDSMATPFQTTTSRNVDFADGYSDPTLAAGQFSETISIFNPYATEVGFRFDILFHFADGTIKYASDPGNGGPAPGFGLGAHRRADYHATQFPTVLAKINANPANRFYSIEIESINLSPGTFNGGVVAQVTRVHNTWGQSLTSIPALDPTLPLSFLDAAEFH
jgi:cyclophilin family peptidyl-prolyl cis-trans isomerase